MKNLVLLLVAIMPVCFIANAQTTPDWTRVLQTTSFNFPAGRVVASDLNNIYLASTISGPVTFSSATYTGVGLSDMIVFKFTNEGNVTWAKQFSAPVNGIINPEAMQVDANQNLFIVGTFNGTATFGNITLTSDATNNAFITKLDADGNPQWATAFAASVSGISKMAFDLDGNTYLLSKTTALMKFNNAGIKLWEQNYPSRTLLAIAISGSNLFVGGALQSATTTFGTINLTKPSAYNKGYIVKANLDGVYSDSLVLNGSPSGDGTTVNDIIADNSGHLIITGGYSNNLIIRNTTYFTSLVYRYFTYLANCDENFVFSWIKSSNAILNARDNFSNRLFQDYTNNIYSYGIPSPSATISYGSVSIINPPQYLFKFDANGVAIDGYGLQNTYLDRTVVTPSGKIVSTGSVANDGTAQLGNFFVLQYNNDVSLNWEKTSSNHQAGSISINYVNHDASGNTYAQARIQGYCNFFGTIINSDIAKTVNAKFDKSGNLLWINQIADLGTTLIYGPKFALDKDNNLLAVGSFKTNVMIENQNLYNSNSFDDGYIVKYSQNGQVSWTTQIVTEGAHFIYGITSDNAGNVIVSGEFTKQLSVGDKTIDAGSEEGAFIIKLDASGNCLWANGYPIGAAVYSVMPSTDENNNIYMAGEMYNSTTLQLVFGSVIAPQTGDDGGTVLVKFSPDGIPQWAYTYGGVSGQGYSDSWPTDLRTDAAGNSYLLGFCPNNAKFGSTTLTNPNGNTYSYYLTKINTDGVADWAEAVYFKSPVYKYGDFLDLDKNGNIYIGGHFRDAILINGTTYTPVGIADFFTAKFANNGTFQWIKTMPSNISGINALSVYDEDVVSICGLAGNESKLGNFAIDRKGSYTSIIATLGVLDPLPNTLFVDFTGESAPTFSFTSNTAWTVTSDQGWLSVSSTSGNGNGTLSFTATENTTGEARIATVTITFLNTKSPSITLTIVQEAGTTGITDLQKNKNLVFPNPASNYLHLNYDDPDALISIYDSKGKMVLNKQINNNEINISSLRNGIYTIRLATKTGTKNQKFVKQ